MIMIINTKLILKKKHPEKTSSYVIRKTKIKNRMEGLFFA